jgi:hypothetical protein
MDEFSIFAQTGNDEFLIKGTVSPEIMAYYAALGFETVKPCVRIR